jgi:hypothetical protein
MGANALETKGVTTIRKGNGKAHGVLMTETTHGGFCNGNFLGQGGVGNVDLAESLRVFAIHLVPRLPMNLLAFDRAVVDALATSATLERIHFTARMIVALQQVAQLEELVLCAAGIRRHGWKRLAGFGWRYGESKDSVEEIWTSSAEAATQKIR